MPNRSSLPEAIGRLVPPFSSLTPPTPAASLHPAFVLSRAETRRIIAEILG